MGKPNIVTKRYMQDNARFADICNFFLFDGQQIIRPEDLAERDVTELAFPKGLKNVEAVEKFRDILKGCCVKTSGGVTYLIIGIENQNDIHYAMVVRNMLYDALNYSSQVETSAKRHRKNKDVAGAEYLSGFAKDDKLVPVVTITIYWNTGNWDGARSLHDMLDINDKSILKYVSDYKLNLIVPEEIEDFDKFKTEIGPLLEFINAADSGEKLESALSNNGGKWECLSTEAIDLLNICLDAKLRINKDSMEGVGSVCRGIEELKDMAREEGREEGVLVTLLQLVRDGLLELPVGVERSGLGKKEFLEKLNQLA
ncbi:MAG: Rpn family recombination-promoting nuclease/putative transposase [Lachnospiraceae bacterium]|nr:Rpn family recombination-promoting nuclease/putative transposase [Lachnospiraceae bacterium]